MKKTYMRFLVLLIASAFASASLAQPTRSWETAPDYKCLSVAQDGAGNNFFLSRAGKLSKIDPSGNILWVQNFSSNAWDVVYNIKDYPYKKLITIDHSGNVIVLTTDRVNPNGTNFFFKVIKISTDGVVLWTKTFNSGTSDLAHAVAIDQDDNIIASGRTTKNGLNSDFLVIKYDKNGNQLWLSTFNSGGGDQLWDLTVSSGNIYAIGNSGTGASIAKFNNNGALLWSSNFVVPNSHMSVAHEIRTDASGNAWISGFSGDALLHYSFFVAKYNTSGKLLWSKVMGNYPDPSTNRIAHMELDKAGNSYVTGLITKSDQNWDIGLWKFDTNGNQKLNVDYSFWDFDIPYGVVSDNYGNAFITSASAKISPVTWNYRTIKFDNTGAVVWNQGYDFCDSTPSLVLKNNNDIYIAGAQLKAGSILGLLLKYTEQSIYVSYPANNAVNQNVTLNVSSTLVTGATTYTIELNTKPDFTGTSIVKSGARTQSFSGLSYGTTYFTRVLTDISTIYGKTTSFTTATAASQCYVTAPANNALNVSWDPAITVHNIGAASYKVQLSTVPDFSSIVKEQTSNTTSLKFTDLGFNTKYYARVLSDISENVWGPTRSFTTNSPVNFSYVSSPANNATNVKPIINVVLSNVPDATLYTVELNTAADFTGTSIVKTSASKTVSFTLDFNTKFYSRVKTDLLNQWGSVIRSFTTASLNSFEYVVSPQDNSLNVPLSVSVSSNLVPGAKLYTIELNTADNFTGVSFVGSSTTRSVMFKGLLPGTTYFSRVKTDLSNGTWGSTNTFFTTTIVPTGKSGISNGRLESDESDEVTSSDAQLNIYPNPFKDKLTVDVTSLGEEEMQIKIYDVNGKEVSQHIGKTNNLIELPTNELSTGLYIMKVTTPKGVSRCKLVKE